jgi:hypothetical protein
MELVIKNNFSRSNISFLRSHSFEKLYKSETPDGFYPKGFKDNVDIIDKDWDGSCYRYITNTKGELFFPKNTKEERACANVLIHEFIQGDNQLISSEQFKIDKIYSDFEYEGNRTKNKFQVYLYESRYIGLLRTQYDLIITGLINDIIKNDADLSKLYLPLLFLMRQGIELGLKSNIYQADEMSKYKMPQKIRKEHSITKLFKSFGGPRGYLKELDLSSLDTEAMKKISKMTSLTGELADTVNTLDKDSYFLRFPVNAAGQKYSLNLREDSLLKIFTNYQEIDSFLTFINQVLLEHGILVDLD